VHVACVIADEIEHRKSIIVANDGLTIDNAGSDGQRLDRFSDERESISKVMPVSRQQLDAATSPMREDAEAIVLDFVDPAGATRRLFRRPR
jgi:hypothetical protein